VSVRATVAADTPSVGLPALALLLTSERIASLTLGKLFTDAPMVMIVFIIPDSLNATPSLLKLISQLLAACAVVALPVAVAASNRSRIVTHVKSPKSEGVFVLTFII
jgi:hypothetical protein